jgi:hypothetical protein
MSHTSMGTTSILVNRQEEPELDARMHAPRDDRTALIPELGA